MPKLLSVNVSLPKEIDFKGKIIRTGIIKEPVKGRVKVRTLNLDGDGQADLIGHGGEMRADFVCHESMPLYIFVTLLLKTSERLIKL